MVAEKLLALFFSYGLIGLLLTSFLSALFFIPGFVDILIPVYVSLDMNPVLIFLVITAGSVLGSVVNYYFGVLGSRYIKIKATQKRSVQDFLTRWGNFSVLVMSFLPPPFPFDIATVVFGFLKMKFRMFIISTTVGKSIKYALFILISKYGIEALLKLASTHGIG